MTVNEIIEKKFRFHTGSIKSSRGVSNPAINVGFDSILVRLKAD